MLRRHFISKSGIPGINHAELSKKIVVFQLVMAKAIVIFFKFLIEGAFGVNGQVIYSNIEGHYIYV